VIYQTEDTRTKIQVHRKSIFEEGELVECSVVKEYLTTAPDCKILYLNDCSGANWASNSGANWASDSGANWAILTSASRYLGNTPNTVAWSDRNSQWSDRNSQQV